MMIDLLRLFSFDKVDFVYVNKDPNRAFYCQTDQNRTFRRIHLLFAVVKLWTSVSRTCLQFPITFFSLQNGLATKVEKSRKQMKERKNRAKKIRGVKKVSTSWQQLVDAHTFFFHLTNYIWCANFADKGWRCQEEVRLETCLAVLILSASGLLRTVSFWQC